MQFIQNIINHQHIQMQEIGDIILSVDLLIHINVMGLGPHRKNIHTFLNMDKV
jgi:hypothetical protein